MYTLAFTYRFEAAHRFTRASSEKCMTPHGHTWRATLTLRATTPGLNADAMVAEFGTVKAGWKRLLDGTLDHSFFAHHEDELLAPMRRAIPHLRAVLFPGDPTTELLAQLLAIKAQKQLTTLEKEIRRRVEVASVRVVETESNQVAFEVPPGTALSSEVNGCEGWWSTPDPTDRHCQPTE